MNNINNHILTRKPALTFKNGLPDYDMVNRKIEALKSISQLNNEVVYVNDYYKNRLYFIGGETVTVFGINPKNLSDVDNDYFINMLKGEDAIFVKNANQAFNELLTKIPSDRYKFISSNANYHYTNNENECFAVNVQIIPFLLDDEGRTWMILLRILPTRKNIQRSSQLELTDTKERYEYSSALKSYVNIKKVILTPKEKQVLIDSFRGLSEKDIAARYSCSQNTIKTHKRNVMNKLAANNISEAYMTAILQKLI